LTSPRPAPVEESEGVGPAILVFRRYCSADAGQILPLNQLFERQFGGKNQMVSGMARQSMASCWDRHTLMAFGGIAALAIGGVMLLEDASSVLVPVIGMAGGRERTNEAQPVQMRRDGGVGRLPAEAARGER
jgi:hypothetical protein